MRQLHLSFQWYSTCDLSIDPRVPTPVCGASDDIATIKRGKGEGLVSPAALSPEFHCPKCYVMVLRDINATEEGQEVLRRKGVL